MKDDKKQHFLWISKAILTAINGYLLITTPWFSLIHERALWIYLWTFNPWDGWIFKAFTLIKGKHHVLSGINLMIICYNLWIFVAICGICKPKSSLKKFVLHFLPIFTIALLKRFYSIPHLQPHSGTNILNSMSTLKM